MDNEYNLTTKIQRLTGEIRKGELVLKAMAEQTVLQTARLGNLRDALQDAQGRLEALLFAREENPPEIELARRALASNSVALMRQRIDQITACMIPLGLRSKNSTSGEEIARLSKIRNGWYDLREQLKHRALTLENKAVEKQKEAERIKADKEERAGRLEESRLLREHEQRVKNYEANNS